MTCNNPEIKYGTTTGGFPRKHGGNDYEKWCEQLGGLYVTHTLGTRTGNVLFGGTGWDDSDNWHWCAWSGGSWYNKSYTYSETYSDFVTSIACSKVSQYEADIVTN